MMTSIELIKYKKTTFDIGIVSAENSFDFMIKKGNYNLYITEEDLVTFEKFSQEMGKLAALGYLNFSEDYNIGNMMQDIMKIRELTFSKEIILKNLILQEEGFSIESYCESTAERYKEVKPVVDLLFRVSKCMSNRLDFLNYSLN